MVLVFGGWGDVLFVLKEVSPNSFVVWQFEVSQVAFSSFAKAASAFGVGISTKVGGDSTTVSLVKFIRVPEIAWPKSIPNSSKPSNLPHRSEPIGKDPINKIAS